MNERIGYRLFREDNRFNACHTCHRWNMKSTASPDDKEDFNLEPTMTDTSNGWYSHFKDSFSSVHMLKIRLTLSIHYVWSNCSKLKILLCFEYRLTRNSLFFFGLLTKGIHERLQKLLKDSETSVFTWSRHDHGT